MGVVAAHEAPELLPELVGMRRHGHHVDDREVSFVANHKHVAHKALHGVDRERFCQQQVFRGADDAASVVRIPQPQDVVRVQSTQPELACVQNLGSRASDEAV